MAETVNDYTETDLGNVAPNPRGDYSETAEYEYLDLVAYVGGSYMCVLEEGTITGTAPTPGKTTEFWQEVSRPGDLTPEYVAMHDDVVNKAASVAEDAAQVAQNAAQVEGMKENVAALQEQTAQDALRTKEYRESAAGYAAAAETSRTAAGESEENIRALVNGFDAHVEEQKTSAQEEITTSRQAAIKAIAAQQVLSVNAVKQEGQNAIDKTNADAEATAADRAAVAEKAATVDGQAAQVAEDKATAENYMQTAGESKKQALEAAERLKDSVDLVQKNTVDLLGKAPVIIGSVTSNDGTPVEVNDSAEIQLQGLRLYGKSKQVVTTGKNLCSIKSCQLSTNIVKSKIVSWTKSSQVYYAFDTQNISGAEAYLSVKYHDADKKIVGSNGATVACDGTRKTGSFNGVYAGTDGSNIDLTTIEYISVRLGLYSDSVTPSFIDNIIVSDDKKVPFEPYTGGKPSPSPEYPQEIVSVGQKLSTGKNLINADEYYSQFKQSDGTYKGKNTVINKIAIPLAHFVGKKIVISANIDFPSTIDTMQIRAAIGENNYYGDIVYPNTNKRSVLTVTVQTQNDNFWFTYGSGSGQVIISDIQVELGSTATSYEPYTGGKPAPYKTDCGIEITRKNLFNANDVSEGAISDDTGNNMAATNSYCSNFIAVSAKTKYYLYSGQGGGRWGAFYDSSKTFILGVGPDKYNSVFETPENAAYIRFTVDYNNNNPDFARNVIFAKSTIAVPFEPYHKSTTTIPLSNGLPGIPVTAGGNYTDENGQQYICNEIDFAAGKYVQRVKEIVLDGSYDEVWAYNIGAHRANIILNNGNLGTHDKRGIASMCSNLLWNRNVYSDSNRENGYLINNNTFFVRVAESLALNTEPDFRTWLASNPITLQYVLATPIETDLSEAQIQAYKSLTTFKPTSIISNDANAQMEVEYAADTKAYIDNKLQEIAQAMVASASEAE